MVYPVFPEPKSLRSPTLAAYFKLVERRIHTSIDALPEGNVLSSALANEAIEEITADCELTPITLGQAVVEEVPESAIEDDPDPRYQSPGRKPGKLKVTTFTVRVPVEDGTHELLFHWPGTSAVPVSKDMRFSEETGEIWFTVKWAQRSDPSYSKMTKYKDEQLGHLDVLVAAANALCSDWNNRLPDKVRDALSGRRAHLQGVDEARKALGMPIRRSSQRPIPFRLPRRRRAQPKRIPDDEVAQLGDYPLLTREDFAEVIAAMRRGADFLAEHPDVASALKDFRVQGRQRQDREQLFRDLFLLVLNEGFRDATGETFSKRGKTDIRVVVDDSDAKVVFKAECKIWSGKTSASEAYSQLVDGYLTYRETRTAIVLFVDGPKVRATARDGAILELEQKFAGARVDDMSGWPVIHVENDGRRLEVAVVIVDITSIPLAVDDDDRDE